MLFVHSDTQAKVVIVESDKILDAPQINGAAASVLKTSQENGKVVTLLDATGLATWSPNHPNLHTLSANGESIRFGFTDIKPFENKAILLNGTPCYLRGYIRGIVAHEHPNMTGGSLKEAAVKNICQAKKYGFNLVRFHSTIPTPEFIEAADEEGLLVHMEIGFAYNRDEQGNKTNLAMDNSAWTETLLKYRSHPSVAIFCIGNEMHNSGHYKEVKALYEQGRELAPGKLIMDNSGWGEFDRQTADVYSQHIAYFFPYGVHADMFHKEDPWLINGSAYDEPIDTTAKDDVLSASTHRTVVPAKPTLAHEAIHYIEIPDYERLAKKFDDFCAKVGPEYLEANGIKKPKFMTELPKLIDRKGLRPKLADYIKASEIFKMNGIKVYLEHCRQSSLCGFEMLQFADCLKYENKNGIVDCFDDDKYIPAQWMRQMTDDIVLLAELPENPAYYGDNVHLTLNVSDFLENPLVVGGDLKVTLTTADAVVHTIYSGRNVTLSGGLQTVAEIDFSLQGTKAQKTTIEAKLTAGDLRVSNSWNFWFYPKSVVTSAPAIQRLADGPVKAFINANAPKLRENDVITDTLDDALFDDLAAGRHVTLLYKYDGQKHDMVLPVTLERFKPCIWDRGSNLGGIIYSDYLREKLAAGRYFEQNMAAIINEGYKVNLDHFPPKPEAFVSGVDKPVRDRMKGIVRNIKNFIDDDTLRDFSHLFSFKVGAGILTVCTFNFAKLDTPAVAAMLAAIVNDYSWTKTEVAIAPETLKAYLKEVGVKGPQKEDTMNHFWEIDNKLVEDTLFWEEAQIDLKKID